MVIVKVVNQTRGKCQTLSVQEKMRNVKECQKNLRIRLQNVSSHTQVASKDTIHYLPHLSQERNGLLLGNLMNIVLHRIRPRKEKSQLFLSHQKDT